MALSPRIERIGEALRAASPTGGAVSPWWPAGGPMKAVVPHLADVRTRYHCDLSVRARPSARAQAWTACLWHRITRWRHAAGPIADAPSTRGPDVQINVSAALLRKTSLPHLLRPAELPRQSPTWSCGPRSPSGCPAGPRSQRTKLRRAFIGVAAQSDRRHVGRLIDGRSATSWPATTGLDPAACDAVRDM